MCFPPELKRILLRGGALLSLILTIFVSSPVWSASLAAPLPQETTPTPSTATNTPSLTPTVSPTGDQTPSGSPSPSVSASPSPSVSPSVTMTGSVTPATQTSPATATISPTAAVSPTRPLLPTLPAFTPVQPATPIPAPLLSPVPLETLPSATPAPPTATLKPFPQITYQYPGLTPTYTLLARQGASPDGSPPKNDGFSPQRAWRSLVGAAPWLLLAGLWIGLCVWFLVSQFLVHRSK